MRIDCVIMAAGNAKRFGKNKLFADYMGEKVYVHALNTADCGVFHNVAVVSQYDEILEAANERGFISILNTRPQDGVSLTIRLGMDALRDADAVMFMVADQPSLTKKSIEGEIQTFIHSGGKNIVALKCKDRRGNPVIFPRKYFVELASIIGDVGGSAVMRRHEEQVLFHHIDNIVELTDIDNEEELNKLRNLTINKQK